MSPDADAERWVFAAYGGVIMILALGCSGDV